MSNSSSANVKAGAKPLGWSSGQNLDDGHFPPLTRRMPRNAFSVWRVTEPQL